MAFTKSSVPDKFNVLIVNDDPMMREGLAAIVNKSGLPVASLRQAIDGDEAMKILLRANSSINLIFCGLDYRFLAEFSERNTTTPVIVVSMGLDKAFKERALKSGAQECVSVNCLNFREQLNEAILACYETLPPPARSVKRRGPEPHND